MIAITRLHAFLENMEPACGVCEIWAHNSKYYESYSDLKFGGILPILSGPGAKTGKKRARICSIWADIRSEIYDLELTRSRKILNIFSIGQKFLNPYNLLHLKTRYEL